ncbi:MAG: PHP domain-containing protein [Erysipelotrichaceae bacterium]
MKYDMHMHSRYSRDGQYSEEALIDIAKQSGMDVIAVCDHNTTKAVPKAVEYGKAAGIRVVPGIECDTLFNGLEVHVLGYDIDPHHPAFASLDDEINTMMIASNKARIELLNEVYGYELNVEELLVKCEGHMTPFEVVVKELLADSRYLEREELMPYRPGGSRDNPAVVNFYWDFCSVGTKAHVRIPFPSLKDTIQKIKDAGGFAIIAHPYKNFYQQETLLLESMALGISGLEAYSNYHTPQQNAYYADFCKKHNLLLTCGSDFHGEFKPLIHMGEYGFEGDDLDERMEPFMKAIRSE